MKKLLKKIYKNNKKFIIAMMIIIVAGNIGILVKKHKYGTSSEFPLGMEVQDFDAYMETQKNVPSDIEGYSVYDKYVMGLQRQDGSDSDFDGLTDKEEIEVYGTDPLKASTAGDLYTDSYKIEHGLDPMTYIEYTQEMEFPFIECPEVSVTPSTPTDFNTVVTDCTNRYTDLSGYGIKEFYKGYELYNYTGTVSIDVHDILVENDTNDFEVYVGIGPFLIEGYTDFKKCKYDS